MFIVQATGAIKAVASSSFFFPFFKKEKKDVSTFLQFFLKPLFKDLQCHN